MKEKRETETSRAYDSRRIIAYALPGGWQVLVGRTAADNDYLSLTVAEPRDWWFHVRSLPGSHVLLLHRTDAEPDRDTLQQAAAIAAYHSKARTAGTVPVACTRAQHVTKPRGAKPGTVHIKKETVFKARPSTPEQIMDMKAQ